MLILYLLLVCSGALAYVRPSDKPFYDIEDAETLFESYIKMYNKNYDSEQEKRMRLSIFKQNLIEINDLNSASDHAVFDINMFTDLTIEEFKPYYTGYKVDPSILKNVSTVPVEVTMVLPDHFDWREHNVVTPIKDQGHCGACWAFSSIGAVEGAYAIKHKKLLSLSEQQLIDCINTTIDHGCSSGNSFVTLDYLQTMAGLESETDYPYTGKPDDKCHVEVDKIQVKVTGKNIIYLDSNYDVVRQALIKYGPISIGVDSSTLQKYNSGLHDCPSGPVDHAMLLIGYGSENGVPYWIFKNSWGTRWGEKGYIRVKATKNACGMTVMPGVAAEVA